MDAFDFIVVGAGMAGAAVAAELAAHGRLLILEAEDQPGVHATGRSAALYAESYGGPAIRALTAASRTFLEAPPPGFAEAALLGPRGVLHIAGPDQQAQLEEMAAALQGLRSAHRAVSGEEACRLLPALRPDWIAGAILDEGAMDMDVDAIHQGFLRLARGKGARLLTGAGLLALERGGDGWRATTAGGTFHAPVIVNAAGAWAGLVGEMAGASPVPLSPLRRTALLIDPQPEWDMASWPAVIDIDEQFYFKPDAGKLLLSPADETPTPPGDAQPEEFDIAVAVHRVQEVADVPVRRVSHAWAGLRTFAPDRAPVVGFDPVAAGFFWLAGQGGYGIQTAPALGRLAAALARGLPAPDELCAFDLVPADISPDRFQESNA